MHYDASSEYSNSNEFSDFFDEFDASCLSDEQTINLLDLDETNLDLTEFLNFKPNAHQQPEPFIEILEQPMDFYRFRYKSEIQKTHGHILGKSTSSQRNKTAPIIQIRNTDGLPDEINIICSLYQHDKINISTDNNYYPHVHQLTLKADQMDEITYKATRANDYKVECKDLRILYISPKDWKSELKVNLQKLKRIEIHKCEVRSREINAKEKVAIDQIAQVQKDSINKDVVCMRFDAYYFDQNGICRFLNPVFTTPIKHTKSVTCGSLCITKLSKCAGSVNGGDEMILLVEKVDKKNIKVRFFEVDDYDNETWSAYAEIVMIHYQYAIVIKTPQYKTLNIDKNRTVFIQIVRPSDNHKSAERAFEYFPSDIPGVKRRRILQTEFTAPLESCYIPNPQNDWIFVNPIQLNHIDCSEEYGTKQQNCHVVNRTISELSALLKTNPPKERIQKMLKVLFLQNINEYGNNALHLLLLNDTIIVDQVSKTIFLLDLIENLNCTPLLSLQNDFGEAAIHLAIGKNDIDIFKKLVTLQSDLTLRNKKHETILHILVKQRNIEMIKILIGSENIKSFIDLTDGEGNTAVQLAVNKSNLQILELLWKNQADMNVVDHRIGGNLIHLAITQGNLEIVQFLVNMVKLSPEHKNYEGLTAYAYACSLESSKEMNKIKHVLKPKVVKDKEAKLKSVVLFSVFIILVAYIVFMLS